MSSDAAKPNSAANDMYAAYEFRVRQSRPATSNDAELFAHRHIIPKLLGLEAEPLLEIGAGTGRVLATLKAAGFANVRGVDSSKYQVSVARTAGIEVELVDGLDALAQQQEGRLSAVLAIDVLEHLPRETCLRCLALSARALRPGGVLIARVPNGAALFGAAIRYGDITHERAFTAAMIRETMMLAGFSSVAVKPVRPLVHGAVSLLRYAIWMVVETGLRVADAAETGERRGGIYTRNLVACGTR